MSPHVFNKCVGIIFFKKRIFLTKKKQTHRYREQTSGYQWGEGMEKGQMGVGTGRYKLLGIERAAGMCPAAWGTEPILCNGCGWSVTFGNCGFLCCVPVSCMVLCSTYTSLINK